MSSATKAPAPAIARRSARPPVKFDEPVCRRCAKRIDKAGRGLCGKQENRNCDYCRKLNKPCEPVPAKFASNVNALFRSYDTAEGLRVTGSAGAGTAAAAVVAAQKAFTKELEAFVRAAGKQGLRKKPTGEDITRLLVKELQTTNHILSGILDVMRFSAGLPALGEEDAETEAEEEVDNAGDGGEEFAEEVTEEDMEEVMEEYEELSDRSSWMEE